MHRKCRSALGLLAFVFAGTQLFADNPYVAADATSDYSRGCEQLTCKMGEQCVHRKFWCEQQPCPTMTYCSKSRKESLKGPDSCESVLCTPDYKCFVRVRDCKWDQKCKLQTARCIAERELLERPESCVDVTCPAGYMCVLRESRCYRPPCKLTRSCARARDVIAWHEQCRDLGCRSEHECFLRRATEKCARPPCNYVPECHLFNFAGEKESADDKCNGWICPPMQECIAHVEEPCKHDDCRVTRFCEEPMPRLLNNSRDFEEALPLQGSSNGVSSGRHSSVPNMPSTSSADSPWLTYLKPKPSGEAVQYWIEKAKNNENYETETRDVSWSAAEAPDALPGVSLVDLAEESRRPSPAAAARPAGPFSGFDRRPPLEVLDDIRSRKYDGETYSRKPSQSYYQRPSPPLHYFKFPESNVNLNDGEILTHDIEEQLPRILLSRTKGPPDTSVQQRTLNQGEIFRDQDRNVQAINSSSDGLNDAEVKAIFEKFTGLKQFSNMHPKIIKIDPVDTTTKVIPLDTRNNLSNLFVYIPPPLNIFIYYSANNQTASEEAVSSNQNNQQSGKINQNIGDNLALRTLPFEAEEKRNEQAENATSTTKPNISGFVEWLQKKGHKVSDELASKATSDKPPADISLRSGPFTEPEKAESSKKVRVLVDVDKNPDIMKILLTRNKTNDPNHEYQVIVNPHDYGEPKLEEVISRKLIEIASSQASQNLTNNRKMPKTLWVFPIYEEGSNVNTLEDVNLSSGAPHDKFKSQYSIRSSSSISNNTRASMKPEKTTDESKDSSVVEDDYEEEGAYDDSLYESDAEKS